MPATNVYATHHRLLALLFVSLFTTVLPTLPGTAFAQESGERVENAANAEDTENTANTEHTKNAQPGEAVETLENLEESDEERALRFYEAASQAYQNGDFARAADLLESARAHHAEPVYVYNQILAYQALERPAYALHLLDEHAEVLEKDGRFEHLAALRGQLRQAVAARDASANEDAQASENKEQSTAVPASIEAPPEVAEASPNILAWSLVGAGGVALGAGVLFGSGLLIEDTVDRLDQSRVPEAELAVYQGSERTRADDLRRLRTHQTLNVVLIASGVSLGVAGATMLFLDTRVDRPHPRALRIAPMLSGEHAGALVGGRF
ncbi:hypothetical protein FRC96_17915 [Lujinxingia vulgaris]|uniref:Tetratricopeptide repeat protein n=1 Tax=Lujinxingia vulgaris TaxID=2600176 RepID=A0A5C6WUQ9_9DELT|nr:hypothetical protein [Lujinxingia vulgaris]TXD32339.1 hypothetical protein FRC96_17915 [Lujinxingia vulgaris]